MGWRVCVVWPVAHNPKVDLVRVKEIVEPHSFYLAVKGQIWPKPVTCVKNSVPGENSSRNGKWEDSGHGLCEGCRDPKSARPVMVAMGT